MNLPLLDITSPPGERPGVSPKQGQSVFANAGIRFLLSRTLHPKAWRVGGMWRMGKIRRAGAPPAMILAARIKEKSLDRKRFSVFLD